MRGLPQLEALFDEHLSNSFHRRNFYCPYSLECHLRGLRLLRQYSENREAVDRDEKYIFETDLYRRAGASRESSIRFHRGRGFSRALLNHSGSGSGQVLVTTKCHPHRPPRLLRVPGVNLLMLSTGSYGRGIGCHYHVGLVDIGSKCNLS